MEPNAQEPIEVIWAIHSTPRNFALKIIVHTYIKYQIIKYIYIVFITSSCFPLWRQPPLGSSHEKKHTKGAASRCFLPSFLRSNAEIRPQARSPLGPDPDGCGIKEPDNTEFNTWDPCPAGFSSDSVRLPTPAFLLSFLPPFLALFSAAQSTSLVVGLRGVSIGRWTPIRGLLPTAP